MTDPSRDQGIGDAGGVDMSHSGTQVMTPAEDTGGGGFDHTSPMKPGQELITDLDQEEKGKDVANQDS